MRKVSQFKPFGRLVWTEISRMGITLFDLTTQIEEKTGRFVSEAWLRKCFTTRTPKWVVDAIREILDIKKKQNNEK